MDEKKLINFINDNYGGIEDTLAEAFDYHKNPEEYFKFLGIDKIEQIEEESDSKYLVTATSSIEWSQIVSTNDGPWPDADSDTVYCKFFIVEKEGELTYDFYRDANGKIDIDETLVSTKSI